MIQTIKQYTWDKPFAAGERNAERFLENNTRGYIYTAAYLASIYAPALATVIADNRDILSAMPYGELIESAMSTKSIVAGSYFIGVSAIGQFTTMRKFIRNRRVTQSTEALVERLIKK